MGNILQMYDTVHFYFDPAVLSELLRREDLIRPCRTSPLQKQAQRCNWCYSLIITFELARHLLMKKEDLYLSMRTALRRIFPRQLASSWREPQTSLSRSYTAHTLIIPPSSHRIATPTADTVKALSQNKTKKLTPKNHESAITSTVSLEAQLIAVQAWLILSKNS